RSRKIHKLVRTCGLSMPRQFLSTSLSEAESNARRFYDRWIGGTGLLSMLGRLIFRLSGVVYSGRFIRAGGVTAEHNVLEIGCGMGSILATTRCRVASTATYLGVDLSFQMAAQGHSRASANGDQKRVMFLIASGLSLPVGDFLF